MDANLRRGLGRAGLVGMTVFVGVAVLFPSRPMLVLAALCFAGLVFGGVAAWMILELKRDGDRAGGLAWVSGQRVKSVLLAGASALVNPGWVFYKVKVLAGRT